MSRIDIAHGAEHRLKQACQTVYKHFLAGRHIWVYCTDTRRLQAFSKGLWEIESTAFVPHPHVGESGLKAHVSLCDNLSEMSTLALLQKEGEKPWLLNLDIACPPNYQQFDRILEIVSLHPEDKRLAKERIRTYLQDQQYVVYHDLGRN